MKFNLIPTKEITDFEKEIGVELIVTERPENRKPRFYVTFEKGDVIGDGVLIGATGNADTIDEAVRNYCSQISGKRMVFNAMSENRREIEIPKLIHTKNTIIPKP